MQRKDIEEAGGALPKPQPSLYDVISRCGGALPPRDALPPGGALPPSLAAPCMHVCGMHARVNVLPRCAPRSDEDAVLKTIMQITSGITSIVDKVQK